MNDNQAVLQSPPAGLGRLLKALINVNIVFILIPETFIWLIFKVVGISLSPIHKLFILFLIIQFLWLFRPEYNRRVFMIFITLFLSSIYMIASTMSVAFIGENLEDITRLMLVFVTFFYCKDLVTTSGYGVKVIDKLIWVSFLVISANLLLGMLGLGNSQRGGDIGTRGFFNAGNDISTITSIVAAFILSEQYEKGRTRFLAYLLFFFFLAYLLNTKALLVSLVMIIGILPIYGYTKRRIPKKIFWRLAVFMAIFPFALIITYFVLDHFHFWDPYFAFIDQFKNDSWITFILSRRDEHLMDGLRFVEKSFHAIHYLIGYGSGRFLYYVVDRAEIDPFEIFFYFGILGVILVYSWFIKVWYRSFKIGLQQRTELFPKYRGLFAANSILLLQSVVSGHVFMSALICIYLGAINSLQYVEDEHL